MTPTTTWVPIPDDSDFSPANLPYGAFEPAGGGPSRVGVALGEHVVDLDALSRAGALDDAGVPAEAVRAPNLDALLEAGPSAWRALRAALQRLIAGSEPPRGALLRQDEVRMVLPFTVRDYVDFYCSLNHATNLGRLFRPGGDPLTPNWRHLPIGYHGRSSTVVLSGTPVRRPTGQLPRDGGPVYAPSERLDFELELGFVTGPGNRLGERLSPEDADSTIFGFVLVNDWSARDIQRWEYVPLGPLLGKSFATSISPWVVPLQALEPYRVEPQRQEPPPLEYLRAQQPWALDIRLEVWLQPQEGDAHRISATNARELYWTASQMLAHAASNGCSVRAGDLYASGTISGEAPDSFGSLIELTWNGDRPLSLDGESRTFLADGDRVRITGWSGGSGGRPRVGFGAVEGQILPAL